MRHVRRSAKLNQEELGEKLGVTRQSISGYETERLVPSTRVIESMCDLYGINPWWLHYGVGRPASSSEGTVTRGSVSHLAAGGGELTHAQRTLIDYIKSNKDAAENLAEKLWNKVLKP